MLRSKTIATRVLAASVLALSACSAANDETAESNADSVIIGANDLLSVSADGGNVPARYRPLLNAFGKLLIPGSQPGTVALCSATHVGNGVVVTAGHCFGAPPTRVNNRPCQGTKIEWGARAGGVASTSSCTEILAMETRDARDYAVLRVDRAPSASVKLAFSTPPPGTQLTMFSHPGGRPLEWSQSCSLMARGGDYFGYQCDTQGGSSGAAVLRDDTLQIVGIHTGGAGSLNSATYLSRTATDTLGPTGDASSGPIEPAIAPGMCLDVIGGSTANGAGVHLWPCHGGANQQWAFTGGSLRVYGDRCLDVADGNDANGARLQIWECSVGNGNQQWTRAGERWQWTGHDKAIDLTDGGTGAGNAVQIWEHYGDNPNQRWTR